jgi:queuine tRNA-ribosyltransferase
MSAETRETPEAPTTFRLEARDGAARAGRLVTPHGSVATPTFMCVATYGAVRGVDPDDLAGIGAQILLANTYHLHERPGEDIVRSQGGLHGFTGWRGPWLTDSGGYQVSSLADRVEIAEEGITFSSPLDGRRRLLTPESVVAIQEALGSDIAMVLDECHVPVSSAEAERDATRRRIEVATDRSLRWAERASRARRRRGTALFGIVQGGVDAGLRRRSARETVAIGFDGYAHGGLGLGEERTQRTDMVEAANEEIPADAPRYLMGLGRPVDLLDGVAAGVDLFDCVVPTRNGRHGVLFTRSGRVHIKNARYKDDPRPPEEGCDCPTCRRHSRAYLRHLLHIDETLGARLATLHNLRFYLRLLEEARRAVEAGSLAALRRELEASEGRRAD